MNENPYIASATYSPEDNKLRICMFSDDRLEKDLYDRVRKVGYRWAPRQKIFICPAWNPAAEDLALEFAGEIDDENSTMEERAAERAERFEQYSEKRQADGDRDSANADQIAQRFAGGQPILVGHHSEKKARKDAERIDTSMHRALKMWETSEYWKQRAAGALHNAEYKQLPGVRARRIKKLAASLRKSKKYLDKSEAGLKAWTADNLTPERVAFLIGHDSLVSMELYLAHRDGKVTDEEAKGRRVRGARVAIAYYLRWIRHYEHRLTYERALMAEDGGMKAEGIDIKPGGKVCYLGEWLTVIRTNRRDGELVSVTTTSPAGMTYRSTYPVPAEAITDYTAPTDDDAKKIRKAKARPPICNYPKEGTYPVKWEAWQAEHTDYRGMRVVEATTEHGAHRVRTMLGSHIGLHGDMNKRHSYHSVFITDKPEKQPPAPPEQPEEQETLSSMKADHELAARVAQGAPKRREYKPSPTREKINQARDTIKAGIKVVSAPTLYPTPKEIARRMVEMAGGVCIAGHRVLEPSAGTGNLIKAAVNTATGFDCVRVVAVEINHDLAGALRGMRSKFLYGTESNFEIHQGDFLDMTPKDLGDFNTIIMNPPFNKGADIKHIEHATSFLKPGGTLVALCANGPRQRSAFMDKAEHWEDLPEGSFKEAGTGVNVALMVLRGEQKTEQPEAREEKKGAPAPNPKAIQQLGLF